MLRTTLQQVGMVKDAAMRGAEAQRVWIDGALLQRKHKEALAALGAAVYERILAGQLPELESEPEIGETVALIEELEVRMDEAAERAREATSRARETAASFAARAGFPDTGLRRRRPPRGARPDDDGGEVRVWRPVMPDDLVADADDDPFDDPPEPVVADDGTVAAVTRPPRRRPMRTHRGAGGIRFVDDDPVDEDADLEEYMHPDDVSPDRDGQ